MTGPGIFSSLLDLGCGLGTELAHLADLGVALTVGVDRSLAALQRAHHLHPAVRFVQGDVLQAIRALAAEALGEANR
jgi:trans-aconitate methyltransferase